MWLEGIKKISLNTEPYITEGFNPNFSGFQNHIVFVRDSGVTETSTGSPTGYIYLNGIKYGDGLDTYINNVTYLNGDNAEHPYSLEFNYVDGSKNTFYVNIGDINNIYQIVSGLSGDISEISGKTEENADAIKDLYDKIGNTVLSASYLPYSSSTSGAMLTLTMMNGDVNYINISDIDYITENYQPRVDDGLETHDTTVSGAINEIYNMALDNKSDISSLTSAVTVLTKQVEILTNDLANAYVDATYNASYRELTLVRNNGTYTRLYIEGGSGSGGCHCHCCCPIVEIMKDGDSWIQKLGRRVTALENYVYNQSGDITNIIYCVDDLRKRVMTLENEVDLDNNLIIDYTTVPVSAWSLNDNASVVTAVPYSDGYPFVTLTTEEGDYNPYSYISMSVENNGKITIDLYVNNDGDVRIEDFGVDNTNFKSAKITKTNGKVVNLNNFNSLQSYFEDFTSLIVDATIVLQNGDIININEIHKVFQRVDYLKEQLNAIDINYDTFDKMCVVIGDKMISIDDMDDAMEYIINHLKDLYNGDIQLSFVAK